MLDRNAVQSMESTKELQAQSYEQFWNALKNLIEEVNRLHSELKQMRSQQQQQGDNNQDAAHKGNPLNPSQGQTDSNRSQGRGQQVFAPIPPPNLSKIRSNQGIAQNSNGNGVVRTASATQPNPTPPLSPKPPTPPTPLQYAQSQLPEQFQGLALIREGVRQIAAKLFSPVSQGLSFGGTHGQSLSDELTRHHLTSRFVDKVLAFSGQRQADGSIVAQGSNYRFSRDASGAISIADVRAGGRGELFSSHNGFTVDRLSHADLKEFAQASQTITSFQQQKITHSQGIEP